MKIISGGQSGADIGGLEGGRQAGCETGGMAPRGYRVEGGSNIKLRDLYGLSESIQHNYSYRTIENIKKSDATVIFATKLDSTGTQLTINTCRDLHKPYLCNPTVTELRNFVKYHNVSILNVAGNRESVSPGIRKKTRMTIRNAFLKYTNEENSEDI